jgi:Xaa-Pro dipeptidase
VRSYKDEYEVRCLEEATALGARGHRSAREAFAAGASEMEIHHAFCRGVGATEAQLPYSTIVALDEKGATLHYETKRHVRDGRVLLLDAGAASRGYACDITRTAAARSCDPRFAELIRVLDVLEQELARAATPGRPYLDVHLQAHRGIARILQRASLARGGGAQGLHSPLPARDRAPPQDQVHGDRQASPRARPPKAPYRAHLLAPGHPSLSARLYFIPLLLRPFRSGRDASAFDWDSIDALTPLGGVRVEDNVVVTDAGPRNLTREHLAD